MNFVTIFNSNQSEAVFSKKQPQVEQFFFLRICCAFSHLTFKVYTMLVQIVLKNFIKKRKRTFELNLN